MRSDSSVLRVKTGHRMNNPLKLFTLAAKIDYQLKCYVLFNHCKLNSTKIFAIDQKKSKVDVYFHHK